MTIWVILSLCIFFTVITIVRPNFMWSILAAVCWFLLFWWTRSNPLAGFVIGDTGDTAIIGVCWGAITFVLLYTINDRRRKKEIAEKEIRENGKMAGYVGAKESYDEYYARLDRVVHGKKK